MGSTLDVNAITTILKQRYTKKKLNTISFVDRPFFAMVPKDENQGGKNLVVGIRNSLPQTRSANFTNAQALATYASGPSTYNSWTIPWFSDYATANITGSAIDQAAGDENALIDIVTAETDGALQSLSNSCAVSLYHNGGGSRGKIASGQGGSVVTLSNPDDITNFALNMSVQVSSDDGTGGAGVTTGGGGNNVGFVIGIDYDAGTLTVSSTLGGGATNWTSIFNGVSAGYYIFAQGDYNSMFPGLAGWLPSTAPTLSSPTFLGMARGSDPTKLAGVRVTGQGSYEETLIQAMTRVSRMGGKPNYVFVNPTDFAGIEKAMQGRVVYNRVTSFDDPEIGFKSITVTGPKGSVEVISDVYNPAGGAFMVQMDTWVFYSMGGVPRTIDEDGTKMLRVYNADAYEVRFVYRGALACTAPGWNATITW